MFIPAEAVELLPRPRHGCNSTKYLPGGENVGTTWVCERGTKAAKGFFCALSVLQLTIRAGSVSYILAGGCHIWLSHHVPGWHPES